MGEGGRRARRLPARRPPRSSPRPPPPPPWPPWPPGARRAHGPRGGDRRVARRRRAHRTCAHPRLLQPQLAPARVARLELVPLRGRREPARRGRVEDEPAAAAARQDVAVAAEGDGGDRGRSLL